MSEKILLKDQLFNKEKVNYLVNIIKKNYVDFDENNFKKDVLSKFSELELKQRIKHISNMLEIFLPNDFKKSLNIILKTLPPLPDLTKTDNDFGDFIFAPFGEYIASNGAKKEFLDISLNAISELTSRFSMEDAIRTFLNEFETETMEKIKLWSKSENYHIRRLASEGTRPKLPWAKKIKLNYKEGITILDNLVDDKTRYVNRSVANHLNDISKIDANFVLETLQKWETKTKNRKEFEYIKKHSLRGLIKSGHKESLCFLGFNHKNEYKIENFSIKNEIINIGENLEFSFEIQNLENEKVNFIIDYKIHFIGKNKMMGGKVFKLKSINLNSSEKIKITKRHPLKVMTTRKLYSGEHFLEILINGNRQEKKSFLVNSNS